MFWNIPSQVSQESAVMVRNAFVGSASTEGGNASAEGQCNSQRLIGRRKRRVDANKKGHGTRRER